MSRQRQTSREKKGEKTGCSQSLEEKFGSPSLTRIELSASLWGLKQRKPYWAFSSLPPGYSLCSTIGACGRLKEARNPEAAALSGRRSSCRNSPLSCPAPQSWQRRTSPVLP